MSMAGAAVSTLSGGGAFIRYRSARGCGTNQNPWRRTHKKKSRGSNHSLVASYCRAQEGGFDGLSEARAVAHAMFLMSEADSINI